MYFSLFCNYLPLEKGEAPSFEKNLNHLHSRRYCAKFGWYWPSGSGEDFQILSMYFRHFVIISPWKKVGPFISTNFSPYHSKILGQVWLKLAQWLWRRRWKCEKFMTTMTTMTTTDNGQILIRKSHLSLRLRWAKNMESTFYMYITNNKLSRRSYCIFRYILRSLSRNSDSWCFYISNVIFQKLYSSCKLAGGLYKLNIYCKNTWETYILQWNVLILPVTPLLAQ